MHVYYVFLDFIGDANLRVRHPIQCKSRDDYFFSCTALDRSSTTVAELSLRNFTVQMPTSFKCGTHNTSYSIGYVIR